MHTTSKTNNDKALTIDKSAQRIALLLLVMGNGNCAFSTSEIYSSVYEALNDDALEPTNEQLKRRASYEKAFERDRALLAKLGITIYELPAGKESEKAWMLDSSLKAPSDAVFPLDALVVDVMCRHLCADNTFPYSTELKNALLKVNNCFFEIDDDLPRVLPDAQNPAANSLSLAYMSHLPARITYCDANGKTNQTLVAPYGLFALRGHLYFVCAKLSEKKNLPGAIRTYRDDRLQAVEIDQTAQPYTIPEDFSVNDYRVLPFQIGAELYTARFVCEAGQDTEKQMSALASLANTKLHIKQDKDTLSLVVPVSNTHAAAVWAVAEHLVPQEPQELIDEWHEVLTNSKQVVISHQFEDFSPKAKGRSAQSHVSHHKRRVGRPEVTESAGRLITLLGGLAENNGVLTKEAIMRRFALSEQKALQMLDEVRTLGALGEYSLAVVGDEDTSDVSLIKDAAMKGVRFRLSPAETTALVEAFKTVGIDPTSAVASSILSAMGSHEYLETHQAEPLTQAHSEALEFCVRALINRQRLRFFYQGAHDAEARERVVDPLGLTVVHGTLCLEAFDLQVQELRRFRFDRMTNYDEVGTADRHSVEDQGFSLVEIAFTDERYLDILEWPGLELVEQTKTLSRGLLPRFNDDWLIPRFAACAGAAVVNDEALMEQVRSYAARLLDASASAQ